MNFAILPQFFTNFEHFVFAKNPGFFAFFIVIFCVVREGVLGGGFGGGA